MKILARFIFVLIVILILSIGTIPEIIFQIGKYIFTGIYHTDRPIVIICIEKVYKAFDEII